MGIARMANILGYCLERPSMYRDNPIRTGRLRVGMKQMIDIVKPLPQCMFEAMVLQ
jgi:hypothetical protein